MSEEKTWNGKESPQALFAKMYQGEYSLSDSDCLRAMADPRSSEYFAGHRNKLKLHKIAERIEFQKSTIDSQAKRIKELEAFVKRMVEMPVQPSNQLPSNDELHKNKLVREIRTYLKAVEPEFPRGAKLLENAMNQIISQSLQSQPGITISRKCAGDAQADIEYIYRNDPEFKNLDVKDNENWKELQQVLSGDSTDG